MSAGLLPMLPVQLMDMAGSSLMIIIASASVRHALALKRGDPDNVIWIYLLWFSFALLIFTISRSVGHLLKHLLLATDASHVWRMLSPVSGSLNSIAFVIVGSITLFFHKIYSIYSQMQDDKSAIESAHKDIVELNLNLEKMVRERTRDLSASERKYRRIFEGSKDTHFICNESGVILDINHAALELLAFEGRSQLIGRNLFSEFVLQPEAKTLKEEIMTRDFVKDVDVRMEKKSGEEIMTLFSATTRSSDEGNRTMLEGTIKDITMRRRMESQLLQADKLASLGQLSAGVAHEINNPLSLILGYAQFLLRETKEGSQLSDDLKLIEKHALNCKKIVEDLLNFSRSSAAATKTTMQLNELVTDVVSVVESQFKLDNIMIESRLDKDIPAIEADPDRMRQVFMNLIMNGRQAIVGRGTITVTTQLVEDGRRILVSFTDSGNGIEPEIIANIFDPFFSTKPTGMGTGLGLSVSYGIVKEHGGEIQVESTTGVGSTFTVNLPVAESRETIGGVTS
jgi:PAS domain S-box-containing protein